MKRPPEGLKELCNRIAAAAASADGARLARLLHLAGLLGGPFPPAADPAAAAAAARRERAPARPDRVGIWERVSRDGETCFVRSMDRVQEWHFWANLGRIEPKGGRRRVVLIGESVARGYLYDPQFTPAMVLQALLAPLIGAGVEVVDLARTDLGIEVGELAASALLLEPDAVVVFSGNNWNVSSTPPGRDAGVEAALREHGIAGLKRLAEDRLAAKVRGMVSEVSGLFRARRTPLVWLVPEFNLGDWRDPVTNAPHLPGTANREWLEHWQAARQALAAGDLDAAAARARRMVELDHGVCVAGLYILAECHRQSSDAAAARRCLELARDAAIWDPSQTVTPRAYGVAQDALRAAASEHGCAVVDLPALFQEHLAGAIPDRRMFLDYCHLTAEGMGVAMAAVASRVLRDLEGVEAPWRGLLAGRPAPSREVEANAAFLAAVHNAHWWQSRDVVGHYCAAAARAWPAIAEVMTRFVEVQTRRTPMLMCRAAEEIAELASPQLQHYLLRSNYQQLDGLLIEAIGDALREIGADVGGRLAQLRREEHGLSRGATNLLDFYYCSAAVQPQEVMWVTPRRELGARFKEHDFYKAYGPESRFVFAGEAGCPARLRLTCRLPAAAPSRGALVLSLNGRPQARFEIGRAWETWDVAVPGEAVREGLNEITLRWPLPDFPGSQALESAADDLADGTPELFPCFGEIHAFTAAAGRPAETLSAPARQGSTPAELTGGS